MCYMYEFSASSEDQKESLKYNLLSQCASVYFVVKVNMEYEESCMGR